MKRRIEIANRDRYIRPYPEDREPYEDKSDFYERWYAKFGPPQERTLPGDEFMKRLKEMVDFE